MRYQLRHATGTVDLALDGERFVVKTQGTGLADKLRTIDVPLSALRQFSVVPILRAQAMVGRNLVDGSIDAELLFTYAEGDAVKKKRLFVCARDPAFIAVLGALASRRPDASLLSLPPEEAMARMGMMTSRTAVRIVVAVGVGLPILAIVIALLLGH